MNDLPSDDDTYLRIVSGHTPDDPAARRAARLLALADSALTSPAELDVDGGWVELESRLDARRALRWFEIVVGVAALFIFSVATYRIVAPVIVAHADERYVAPATASLTVRMPDGSRAVLQPLARVRYRASFFRPPRVIALEGEARFLVRPDAAHPFEVHAREVTVTAIGTIFTVRANPWEPTVHVTVEQGAVRVSPNNVLGPGQSIDIP